MGKNYNTLEYYNKNAKLYCKQTLVGNMKENYDRFLKQLPQDAYILDFECGSGRDSKYFLDSGYKVKAIDGSVEMCKLDSEYINQKVNCMKFEELNDIDMYNGIWACYLILHIEKEKLTDIIVKIIKNKHRIFTDPMFVFYQYQHYLVGNCSHHLQFSSGTQV